jgi:hypothetical protein
MLQQSELAPQRRVPYVELKLQYSPLQYFDQAYIEHGPMATTFNGSVFFSVFIGMT